MHAPLVRIILALFSVLSLVSASAPLATTPVLSSALVARHNRHHTHHRVSKARAKKVYHHPKSHHHSKKGHKARHAHKHKSHPKKKKAAAAPHQYAESSCGGRGVTSHVTTGSGPNGAQSYFNCGINAGGWKPPLMTLGMIKTVSMESSAAERTFRACQKYRTAFEKYGKQYDIPPIMLAAIAMQESSCNADTMGDNGGAFGLMQITRDKCGGAPNGDCRNVDFNIRVGTKTLKDCIDRANGNVLEGLASYNGWFPGMTHQDATAVAKKECSWQQNLDYLQQMLNGWLLGVDPYSRHLGTIQNLAACGA